MFAKRLLIVMRFRYALSSQALYFHLAMRADDDGFINNPKNCSEWLVVGRRSKIANG